MRPLDCAARGHDNLTGLHEGASGRRTGIVVVDDDALVCRWLRSIIEPQPDLEIVGEATDGVTAIALAGQLHPPLVVTDIRMQPLDGIETTRRILQASPGTRVLVLTTFALDEYLYQALRAGASGFMLKSASPEELLQGIRIVASGDGLISPSMTRKLINTFVATPSMARDTPALPTDVTGREREVLIAIGRGLTNLEISAKLHISMATTKTHVSRLLTKLGARERAQLVIAAYESGLVAPGRVR